MRLGLTFESIVKFELSSSSQSIPQEVFAFESIVKFELSSSLGQLPVYGGVV